MAKPTEYQSAPVLPPPPFVPPPQAGLYPPGFNPRAIPADQGFAPPAGLIDAGAAAWNAFSNIARQVPGVAGASDALTAPGRLPVQGEIGYGSTAPEKFKVGQGPLSWLGENPAALGPGTAILDPFAGTGAAVGVAKTAATNAARAAAERAPEMAGSFANSLGHIAPEAASAAKTVKVAAEDARATNLKWLKNNVHDEKYGSLNGYLVRMEPDGRLSVHDVGTNTQRIVNTHEEAVDLIATLPSTRGRPRGETPVPPEGFTPSPEDAALAVEPDAVAPPETAPPTAADAVAAAPAEGTVRLYRGERNAQHATGIGGSQEQLAAGEFSDPNRGRWFTTEAGAVAKYGDNVGFVDVPAADLPKYQKVAKDNTYILPPEIAAQKQPLNTAPAALAEAAPVERFVARPVAGAKSVFEVVDTQTGRVLDGGGTQAGQEARARDRNAATTAQVESKAVADATVPADSVLRGMSTDDLSALRRAVKGPAAQQRIDALLGERTFAIAPADQLAGVVEGFDRKMHSEIRKLLRANPDLSGQELLGLPFARQELDKALIAKKVEATLANRNALAQSLVDKGNADNLRNAAVNAAREKTGIPAVDKANDQLHVIAEDAKAGDHPTQTMADTAVVIRDLLAQVPPEGVVSGVGPNRTALQEMVAAKRPSVAVRGAPSEYPAADLANPETQAAIAARKAETAAARDEFSNLPPVENTGQPTLFETTVQNRDSGVGTPAGDMMGPPGPPIFTKVGGMQQPFGKRIVNTTGKLLSTALDLFGATRNIASGDVSSFASQTFPMLFKQPVSYARGHLDGLRDLFRNPVAFETQQQKYRDLIGVTGISTGPNSGQLFLRGVGTDIVRGDERYAGIETLRNLVGNLTERIPALKYVFTTPLKYLERTEQQFSGSINAVATYSYLSRVKGLEWLYGRPLDLIEKQGIANNINVLLGRGYNLQRAGVDREGLVTLSKVVQAFGFSPQNTAARARILPDMLVSLTRVMNDMRESGSMFEAGATGARGPRPQDLDQIHGAAALVASALSTLAIGSTLMRATPVLDSGNTNYLKVDLGPKDPKMGPIVGGLEAVGFHTQTYNGHVYLDPGLGVSQDMRLVTELVGPLFGHLPTNSKGHAWNPWDAKGTDPNVMSLMIRFAENRLHPGASTVASVLEGHPVDLGDPTQNPVTSLLIPMFIQAGLSASGLTDPGQPQFNPLAGSLGARLPFDNLSQSEIEKTRLAVEAPPIPGMNDLSADRQKAFLDQTKAAQDARTASLLATPQYQEATDTKKAELLAANTTKAGEAAKLKLATEIAMTGKPGEVVPAIKIALGLAPANLTRGALYTQLQSAGRLTPENVATLDALRKQPDPKKPSYDPSVQELITAKALSDRWLAAPEFTSGNKAQWDAAALAASRLRVLRAALDPKIDPHDNAEIVKFYNTQGGPLFTTLYTFSGAKNPNAVHPVRKNIQQDPLWTLVAASSAKLDHPTVP